MTTWKESIYRKHPWIIPIVPFIILFFILFFFISYLLAMFRCPLKVWTAFNRFGSKMVSWIPKEEITREFSHAGFNCLVHKDKSRSLYGCVVLPREHPYYGKGPWDVRVPALDALERFHISTPLSGTEPWKITFYTHEDYDTIDFVVNKTKELAEQLAILQVR